MFCYQGDHFSKNVFPGCNENRSKILKTSHYKLLTSDEICTLLTQISVKIRKNTN